MRKNYRPCPDCRYPLEEEVKNEKLILHCPHCHRRFDLDKDEPINKDETIYYIMPQDLIPGDFGFISNADASLGIGMALYIGKAPTIKLAAQNCLRQGWSFVIYPPFPYDYSI